MHACGGKGKCEEGSVYEVMESEKKDKKDTNNIKLRTDILVK